MSEPVSLPCRICGPFKCQPLTTWQEVEAHERRVHGIGVEPVSEDERNLAHVRATLARLHGLPPLEVAGHGVCDDCARTAEADRTGKPHPLKRYRLRGLALCRQCALARLHAPDVEPGESDGADSRAQGGRR